MHAQQLITLPLAKLDGNLFTWKALPRFGHIVARFTFYCATRRCIVVVLQTTSLKCLPMILPAFIPPLLRVQRNDHVCYRKISCAEKFALRLQDKKEGLKDSKIGQMKEKVHTGPVLSFSLVRNALNVDAFCVLEFRLVCVICTPPSAALAKLLSYAFVQGMEASTVVSLTTSGFHRSF